MPQDRLFLMVAVLLGLTILLAIPALIAMVRRHPERTTIYRLMPLTLFSFILWGALIIWAASDKRDEAVISRYVARLRKGWGFTLVLVLLVVGGIATTSHTAFT